MTIFLLILFFGSLAGIVLMIGRKLALLKNGTLTIRKEEIIFGVPPLEKVKNLTIAHTKKLGHASLVATLRMYVRASNFLKNRYEEMKTQIKSMSAIKNIDGIMSQKKEASGFLKMISDYKKKIREIKHKIHEEESK